MTKILWYARGGAFTRMGPFESQVAATRALRLSPRVLVAGQHVPRNHGLPDYPLDAFVWPEEVLSP